MPKNPQGYNEEGVGTSYNMTRMSSGKLFMKEMAEAIDFNDN